MSVQIDIKDRDCGLTVVAVLRALQAKFESQSAYEEERADDAKNHRDALAEEAHCAACEAWGEAALICQAEAISLEMEIKPADFPTLETIQ
jgi:hypothetical protein